MRDRIESLHDKGIACHNVTHFRVPDEYRRFIGVLSDSALQLVSFKTVREDVLRSKPVTVGPAAFVPTEDIDAAIRASGGSQAVLFYLLTKIKLHGAKALRMMSTKAFEGEFGVGARKLDALVAFGVRDARGR